MFIGQSKKNIINLSSTVKKVIQNKEDSTINNKDNDSLAQNITNRPEKQTIKSLVKQREYFELVFSNNLVARLYLLNSKTIRYYIDPTNKFIEPEQSQSGLNAQIFTQDIYGYNGMTEAKLEQTKLGWQINTKSIEIDFDQENGTMGVIKHGQVVMQETEPVKCTAQETTQTLKTDADSYYYGGGTQNGRFDLTGAEIKIVNTNDWVDQGVASPSPFYWSSKGYGVVRNTFTPGKYLFNNNGDGTIKTSHQENRFDAIYFFDSSYYDLIHDYHELTGEPILMPIFGFYQAHLNAYNRDYWVEVSANTEKAIKYPNGKYYKEYQPKDLPAELKDKSIRETLNGENGGVSYLLSARAMIDQYLAHDMPIGWFLPNDGYGAGYGQTDTLNGNLENLAQFVEYANSKGVEVGLWTQQNLEPVDPANPKPDDRDFEKEIEAGVVALKTDVAWVGDGYSFGLNATQTAAKMIAKIKGNELRPFIVTVDGWAGTQNTAAVWTGDEAGGEWEYIRFQIPTYIGNGLSGQPNSASDMDGIFGGKNQIVNTRDYQWKAFTPIQLNMDGWGDNPKNPFTFDETTTKLNRAYLKQKTMLLPYIYSIAFIATFAGKPMIRAMFLEYPDLPQAYTEVAKYQYLWGDNFLIAPIYEETAMDQNGNDIRNGIYLPDKNQIWIDFYTGQEYQGGQILNSFSAPLWKLPVFVKAGAIIPMTTATNTPQEYLSSQKMRKFLFYPDGTSDFTVYEDDGISAKYREGEFAQTIVKSVKNNSDLEIAVLPTSGSYKGMEKVKSTELIIRGKKYPSTLNVKCGTSNIQLRRANDVKNFQKSTNAYFLDQKYLVNPYLAEFSNELGQSFLRIKLEDMDVTKSEIIVSLRDFE